MTSCSGGGAVRGCDGWPFYSCNAISGNLNNESVEVDEMKLPVVVWEIAPEPDSGGPGQWRGAVGTRSSIQPRHHEMGIALFGWGVTCQPQGVSGGGPGGLACHWVEGMEGRDGRDTKGNVGTAEVRQEQIWCCVANGGGGYGDPLARDPEAVAFDLRNGFITEDAARGVYGVEFIAETDPPKVDRDQTLIRRAELKRS
jgi:N-methylhydantoinase B